MDKEVSQIIKDKSFKYDFSDYFALLVQYLVYPKKSELTVLRVFLAYYFAQYLT